MKIVYELVQVKKFKSNDVIFNDQTYEKQYGYITLVKPGKVNAKLKKNNNIE